MRQVSDFFHLELHLGHDFAERGFGLEELSGGDQYRNHASVLFNVADVHIGIEQGFQDRFIIVSGKHKHGPVIEHVGHGALAAQLGFTLGEHPPNFTKGAIAVIREGADQYHAATGPDALIQCCLEILAAAAGCFLQCLINDMAGHLIFFGPVNQAAQGQITTGVGTAILGADINFTAVFGIDLGFDSGCFGHGDFAVLKCSTHRNASFFCIENCWKLYPQVHQMATMPAGRGRLLAEITVGFQVVDNQIHFLFHRHGSG